MTDNILLEIEKVIMPYLEEMFLDLVDIEYVSEGGYNYLRIYIEKPEGSTNIDDCVELSEKIDPLIENFIKDKFFLEVSTPGLERRIKKEKDFLRFKGKKIKMQLKSKIKDTKNMEGILLDYVQDKVLLDLDGEKVEIPIEKMKKVNLVFDMSNYKEDV